MNYRAVYGVLYVVLTGAAGCAGGGEGSGNSGLTNGGFGGTFPTGGIGASGVGGAAGTLGGAGGAAGTLGGTGGVAGVAGGVGGAAGMVTGGMSGGASGMTGGMGGGVGGMAGGTGGTGGPITDGDCCPDGNCLCHGDPPSALTTAQGPYAVDSFDISTGTVYYPTDAEPPFAVIAICPGFLNSGPEMAPWGPFYASWGFVLVQTATLPTDFPDIRAGLLLGALEEVKGENTDSSSPLSGKLSDRFGTTGYSMGGGGTTIASTTDPTLKTSIGLAAWGPVGAGITTPTLLLCGQSDGTAPCNMSEGSYSQIPEATPKMMLSIPGTTHFNWFGPEDAGGGMSGERALAFQKVYLEGDTRWHDLLLTAASGGAVLTTNID